MLWQARYILNTESPIVKVKSQVRHQKPDQVKKSERNKLKSKPKLYPDGDVGDKAKSAVDFTQ